MAAAPPLPAAKPMPPAKPMPEVTALAYVGIASDRTEEWRAFAGGLLGMQQVDRGGGLSAWRMDDRRQRLFVDARPGAETIFGWEVESAAALDAVAARLERAGVAVARAPAALVQERLVEALAWFRDPAGNRVELCLRPARTDSPFRPGRPITGFRTGPLGMGHAVLNVEDPQAMVGFYRDILGFRVSDYGQQPYPLYFFHINGRHHSFAVVGSGRNGIHHFMVECLSLDDVGQGHDLAALEEGRLAYTLGRHSNDWMTSFYAHSPSGFFVEYGWGGRVIDPATWEPVETTEGPSLWGHERLYLDEPGRTRLREMRLKAARDGLRAESTPPCLWAESLRAPS